MGTDRRKALGLLLAAVLLGQFALRGELGIRRQSPVWDERLHVGYGLLWLEHGPAFDPQDHPYPLAALLTLPISLQISGAHKAERAVLEDPATLLPARRVDLALATLALALLAWGLRQRFGAQVALTALAIGSLDPGWLAPARFVTTDIGLGLAFLLASYALVRHRETGRWQMLALAGLALTLGLSAKWSALLLIPAALLVHLLPLPDAKTWPQRLKAGVLAATALALIGIGLFLLLFVVQGALHGVAPDVALGHVWQGFQASVVKRSLPRGVWLLGTWHTTPTSLYFPVLLAAKTPIALLVLSLCALALPPVRARVWQARPLFVVPMFYLAAAIATRQNLGIRQMTPVLACFWLIAALAAAELTQRGRAGRWLAGALALALALEVLPAHPHELAFTNGLFGGLDGAHRVAVDAATDWGQELPALHDYLQQHPAPPGRVDLAYYGNADPEPYVGKTVWRPCGFLGHPAPAGVARAGCDDPAEVLAVSATCREGAAGRVKGRRWNPTERDDCYAWLREREPDAVLGGAILVFRDVKR